MTNTATVATASPDQMAIGDTIAHRSGVVTVAVQRVGPQAWRVSVNDGHIGGFLGRELDGASYPSFAEALAEYSRMFKAFYDGATPAQLAERREDLAILIEADERRYGPEAKARAYRRRIEADAIAPLAGRAVQMALVTDLRDFLTAARAA